MKLTPTVYTVAKVKAVKLPVARLTAAFSLLLVACNGCTGSSPMSANENASNDAGTIDLTQESAGKPLTLRAGQHLRLSLKETPTTGYQWKVSEACSDHLTPQSDGYAPPAGDSSQKIGGAGEHTWVFRAGQPGTCELKLQSARSWEKDPSGPVLTFPLTITK